MKGESARQALYPHNQISGSVNNKKKGWGGDMQSAYIQIAWLPLERSTEK